jgi:hypothetical protein
MLASSSSSSQFRRKGSAGLGRGNKIPRVQFTSDGVEEIWNLEVHAAFMEGKAINLGQYNTI